MNYQEALAYLKGRERFGIKFGLSNIDRLSEHLGRPERRFTSILVAGTNGKGSTVALLDSILRACGYRTGRYTSPHIRRLEERIAVDGRPIPPDDLARVVSRVVDAARGGSVSPTFFEAVTASGFVYFAEKNVDVAVLEVGMGGRFDATNIAPAAVSLITPVGFDHERFLGTTIAAIAAEKAAIIKSGRPVVVGDLHPHALDVVREEAARKGAPLVLALHGIEAVSEEETDGQNVRLRTADRDYGRLWLPLLGQHQIGNLALSVRAAEVAHRDRDLFPRELSVANVRAGVEDARWPGRLERVPGRPALLMDAAHNVMAVESLARFLRDHPHPGRVLVFGVMKDKRVHEMLEILLPHAAHFVATRPEMSRARSADSLARWARGRGIPSEAVRSPAEALKRARELAGENGEVLVAGSIFLLGEISAALEADRTPSGSLA